MNPDSPFLALVGRAMGTGDGARHSEVLRRRIEQLANGRVTASRHGAVQVPEAERGDLVQTVHVRFQDPVKAAVIVRSLLDRNPWMLAVASGWAGGPALGEALDALVVARADEALAKYLRTCLGNGYLTEQRKRQRERRALLASSPKPGARDEGLEREAEETLRIVQDVVDSLARSGLGFTAEAVQEHWRQIEKLAAGECRMEDLTQQEVARDPDLRELVPELARKKARWRLQTRHYRLRKAVREELSKRIRRKVVSPEDGQAALAHLGALMRRQIRPATASTSVKEVP